MVARRAALLSGVAVATVLIQTGRAVFPGKGGKPSKNEPKIGVGVDGRQVPTSRPLLLLLNIDVRQLDPVLPSL
jgi:hypothetical protein